MRKYSLISIFFKRGVRDNFVNFLRGASTFSTVLTTTLISIKPLRRIGIYPRLVKTLDGFRIYINGAATLLTNIPDQYIRREYELHKDYFPKRGQVVLDVGAYIGLYSLRASFLIGEEGYVHAFEPNPLVFLWLKRNVELNKVNNVRVYPVALSDHDESTTLNVVVEGNIEMSSMYREHVEKSLGIGVRKFIPIKVPMFRLDTLAQEGILEKVYDIDLMKIDVEGAELNVLRGSSELLRRKKIYRLIIEVHLDIVNEIELISFLQDLGYRVEKIVSFNNIKKVVYAKAIK